MVRTLSTILFLLIISNVVVAQDYTKHNWYFGAGTQAIRFSRSNNTPTLVTKTPLGLGGAATATNPINSNLMFYTDGSTIYDLTHAVMTNGSGLNGNVAANQPAVVCPVPGQPDQYYVFTNSALFNAGGNIVFSIVDMTQFGNAVFPSPPIGAVTSKNQGFGLSTNDRSEAMITIPHSNGTDYWLISHQNGTDTYTVTQVAAGGSFTHNTISGVTGTPFVAGNFAYHAGTGKIAVTPQDANRDVVILDFDNTTGALSLDQFVTNSATAIPQDIYDTEWSPDGRFLYISRNNDVLQFDRTNPSITLTSILPATVFKSYGLQIAPDTAIYHLFESAAGVFNIARIDDADSVASKVVYTINPFGSIDFDAKQFPSFIAMPTITPSVTFTTSGTCQNSPITFYPTVIPGADSLVWDFGDGAFSNSWSPVHLYQNAGAFNVTVTPYLNGVAGTPATNPLNLTTFTLQISLVQDTTACRCEFPPPIGTSCHGGFSVTASVSGGSPASSIWSNGDTGLTLTPDSAGYYYLIVDDGSGCQAYAGVNVREYDAIDQRANIWYFGQNAGIDFNEQPAVAITGPINTTEGVSVISDRNGEVIFSTDGVHVYDRNDAEVTIANGSPIPIPPGIGGEQGSTQSALIVPVPGDETLYYIFTTQEIDQGKYELRYSLYDIKLDRNGDGVPGDGGLVEYNQLLFSPCTERITGNANWLIAHEFGNNSFRAYPISAMGIGTPVVSSIGSDHNFTPFEDGQGYMKLGNGTTLAVAYSTPGISNTIELFDFVDSTGVVTNYRSANTKQASGQIYGIEFAGNKLFATITGPMSRLVEFYLDSLGAPHLIEPSIAPIAEQLGAIQQAPDGQLYIAVNGKPYLASISVNGDTTMTSNVNIVGFPLAGGTTSTLGLPNFIQSVGTGPQLATMLVDGFCFGPPTDFTGTGTDPIDQFLWSFGDGFTSTDQVTQHTYATPSPAVATDFIVTLEVTNRCGLDTLLTQTITMSAPPAAPTFLAGGPLAANICNGPLTLDATTDTDPGLTFLWTTGDTTKIISVNQQSIVGVTITNSAGCPTYGELFVVDDRPQFELGPDQTLCQNAVVAPLDAQNPGATFDWFINNVASGNNQTQSVTTSGTGTFKYKAKVTYPNSCTASDSVTFTIKESPNFTAVPGNTSGCGTMTGQIDLTINSPGGSLFSYFITGPGTSLQGIDQSVGPVAGTPFGSLGAGTYGITVQDQVTQCFTITTVGISDNVITAMAAAVPPFCDPVVINVQTNVASFPAQYSVKDASNNQVIAPTNFGTATFDTSPVSVPGDYTVQIDAGGCIVTTNVSVVSDPQVVLSLSADGCSDPISINAAGGTSWAWSGPNITGATNGPSITATPPQGNQTYTVTASEAGLCPTTQSIVVLVNNNLTIDFNQSDPCANTVTLTATPSSPGTYTYSWLDNGASTPGAQTLPVATTSNGHTFSVSIYNTKSGCTVGSANKTVDVLGLMQVTMLPPDPLPCEGQAFILTATSSLPGATFQWFRNGISVGNNTATYQDTQPGTYKVIASVFPQCPDEAENDVTLFPLPDGNLANHDLICNSPGNPDPDSREILLDAGTGFTRYAWYKDGVELIGETSQTYLVTEPGTYTAEFDNTFGCTGTDEIIIDEECDPRIIAPTAFRPGSQVSGPDGPLGTLKNGFFGVLTFAVQDEGFQVFIFNRWGEMVFQADQKNFEWNGQYNNSGQLLPAGTYSYVIKYISEFRPEDGVHEKRGGVVLVR